MVRLNRRVGYNRDTYILCRLCDRVVMIPEQVRRKLDAGQGHIVGQVAVRFPVEQVDECLFFGPERAVVGVDQHVPHDLTLGGAVF